MRWTTFPDFAGNPTTVRTDLIAAVEHRYDDRHGDKLTSALLILSGGAMVVVAEPVDVVLERLGWAS